MNGENVGVFFLSRAFSRVSCALVQDLEASRENAINGGEVEGSIPAAPEEKDDLTEYKFQKFAATYFQGTASHQYQRKPLKNSLLPLQTQGDTMVSARPCALFAVHPRCRLLCKRRRWIATFSVFVFPTRFQAALALWITILRFMGDLPEPKFHTMDRVRRSLSFSFL